MGNLLVRGRVVMRFVERYLKFTEKWDADSWSRFIKSVSTLNSSGKTFPIFAQQELKLIYKGRAARTDL